MIERDIGADGTLFPGAAVVDGGAVVCSLPWGSVLSGQDGGVVVFQQAIEAMGKFFLVMMMMHNDHGHATSRHVREVKAG